MFQNEQSGKTVNAALKPNTTKRDDEEPGPFPPYPSHHSCIQEITHYSDRVGTKGRLADGEVIEGALAEDPCSHGNFLFTPIPGTNLYLLVLDQYEDLHRAWNLNCHVLNHVHVPGKVEVLHGACDGEFAPILYRRPQPCNDTIDDVTIPCGHNRGTRRYVPVLLIVLCVFHSISVSQGITR